MPVRKHILYFLFVMLLSCIPSLLFACSKHQTAQGVKDRQTTAMVDHTAKKEKSCCKKAANDRKHCNKCTRSGCGKTCHCAPYTQQFVVLTNLSFRGLCYKAYSAHSFKPFISAFISSDYSFIWTPPKIG